MALADFIAQARRSLPANLDRIVDDAEGARKSFEELTRSLAAADERLDAREQRREGKAHKALDLKTLREKFNRGELDTLTPREVRIAPSLFREFSRPAFSTFLRKYPRAWPRFIRALVRQWSSSNDPEQWDYYASLSMQAAPEAWPVEDKLPIPRAEFVSSEGPAKLAKALQQHELPDIIHRLGEARVRPNREIVGQVAVEWLRRQARQHRPVSGALQFLLDRQQGARWLPGIQPEQGHGSASRALKVAMVAALLDCRYLDLLGDEGREDLDAKLLAPDPDFGDPRLNPSGAWEEVRQKSPEGFAYLLETLITEDLRFFFDHAMKEPDRGRFWLRYVRSIRRTWCVLDPESYAELRGKASKLPADLRRAFGRTHAFKLGEASAFCLYFDDFVVVEFSVKNHATYMYARETFKRLISVRPEQEKDLKDQKLCTARLTHQGNWEQRFEAELNLRGVSPARWSQRNGGTYSRTARRSK
jgi:hypothetical protein